MNNYYGGGRAKNSSQAVSASLAAIGNTAISRTPHGDGLQPPNVVVVH